MTGEIVLDGGFSVLGSSRSHVWPLTKRSLWLQENKTRRPDTLHEGRLSLFVESKLLARSRGQGTVSGRPTRLSVSWQQTTEAGGGSAWFSKIEARCDGVLTWTIGNQGRFLAIGERLRSPSSWNATGSARPEETKLARENGEGRKAPWGEIGERCVLGP
jgi:hypothetical protein